jgi:hypothetical protein
MKEQRTDATEYLVKTYDLLYKINIKIVFAGLKRKKENNIITYSFSKTIINTGLTLEM